jgi:hypothetical protein
MPIEQRKTRAVNQLMGFEIEKLDIRIEVLKAGCG